MGTSAKEPLVRIGSIDAYRGFVMFLMMAEVLSFSEIAENFPTNEVWKFLAKHQSHVEWAGCSLHDLIQPSFSFLVGVALPFSLASRRARGQSSGRMIVHAVWRAFLLVALGIFLRSSGPRTNFTFEDTLTQIGLGYIFLFVLGFVQPKWSWIALAVILVGYWAAFALYPLPGPDFDYRAAGANPDWAHNYTGFAAHWNKNTNLAMAFDRWFLNLFPRNRGPFAFNDGGYATLSFIPTLGTMILGLIAGRWLHEERTASRKVAILLLAGGTSLTAGLLLDRLGICPSVKRIWTPAWTLFSGGWCFILLAGFYAIIDGIGLAAWSFPLRVIGMNSIAAYCMAHLIEGWVKKSLRIHLGQDIFKTWGTDYQPLVAGAAVLLVFWLILFWMYRRKIFLRI